ncbi:hypothetical protein [Paenibacillus prosopidis]|uniref:ABC-2 family transporter n=1 Tax=Paenibacillus prosopidis TaxID=630520 RepID=A0A368W1L2_9BACL|nr:hypothetical protein [Paenibacillus prosopidis]RCW48917.1 hypothetical protein DFP97_105101 [Paenibacillus prosopidis]
MSEWKGAWFLAKHEMLKDRWRSLITLAFIIYLLIFSIPLFTADLEGESNPFTWATDFIYLSLLPCLGFVFNKTMMGYWKNDTYTKKMAQWRTMPISSKQIALGRLIQLTIVLFIAQLIFFTLQYSVLYMNHVNIPVLDFVMYGLFWFCYSLALATAYVYWEIGHTGKTYFLMNFICIFGFLVITICLAVFKAGNIVVTSLHVIENGNWWIVLAVLAVTVAALFIGKNRMVERLEKRSYRA